MASTLQNLQRKYNEKMMDLYSIPDEGRGRRYNANFEELHKLREGMRKLQTTAPNSTFKQIYGKQPTGNTYSYFEDKIKSLKGLLKTGTREQKKQILNRFSELKAVKQKLGYANNYLPIQNVYFSEKDTLLKLANEYQTLVRDQPRFRGLRKTADELGIKNTVDTLQVIYPNLPRQAPRTLTELFTPSTNVAYPAGGFTDDNLLDWANDYSIFREAYNNANDYHRNESCGPVMGGAAMVASPYREDFLLSSKENTEIQNNNLETISRALHCYLSRIKTAYAYQIRGAKEMVRQVNGQMRPFDHVSPIVRVKTILIKALNCLYMDDTNPFIDTINKFHQFIKDQASLHYNKEYSDSWGSANSLDTHLDTDGRYVNRFIRIGTTDEIDITEKNRILSEYTNSVDNIETQIRSLITENLDDIKKIMFVESDIDDLILKYVINPELRTPNTAIRLIYPTQKREGRQFIRFKDFTPFKNAYLEHIAIVYLNLYLINKGVDPNTYAEFLERVTEIIKTILINTYNNNTMTPEEKLLIDLKFAEQVDPSVTQFTTSNRKTVSAPARGTLINGFKREYSSNPILKYATRGGKRYRKRHTPHLTRKRRI